jgi:hypothetical protein
MQQMNMRPMRLLEHLVGAGEHEWRHGHAHCSRGFYIDDKFEGRGLLRGRSAGRVPLRIRSLAVYFDAAQKLTPCSAEKQQVIR